MFLFAEKIYTAASLAVRADDRCDGLMLRMIPVYGDITLLFHLAVESQLAIAAAERRHANFHFCQAGDLANESSELLRQLWSSSLLSGVTSGLKFQDTICRTMSVFLLIVLILSIV